MLNALEGLEPRWMPRYSLFLVCWALRRRSVSSIWRRRYCNRREYSHSLFNQPTVSWLYRTKRLATNLIEIFELDSSTLSLIAAWRWIRTIIQMSLWSFLSDHRCCMHTSCTVFEQRLQILVLYIMLPVPFGNGWMSLYLRMLELATFISCNVLI